MSLLLCISEKIWCGGGGWGAILNSRTFCPSGSYDPDMEKLREKSGNIHFPCVWCGLISSSRKRTLKSFTTAGRTTMDVFWKKTHPVLEFDKVPKTAHAILLQSSMGSLFFANLVFRFLMR